jgi:hypothetical protein
MLHALRTESGIKAALTRQPKLATAELHFTMTADSG